MDQQQTNSAETAATSSFANMLVPISANYPSFAISGSSKLLNPTISDMELVWNWIKIGAYFGSLLLCLAPSLSDAWKYPKSDDTLEDEISELLMLDEEEGNALFRDQQQDDDDRDGKNKNNNRGSAPQKKKSASPSRWSSLKVKVGKTAQTVKTTTLHSLRVAILAVVISIFTYTTWSFILRFLEEDRNRFIDFSQWIARSDWMTASYKLVSLHPEQWFWSAQLLFFVVPMTLFIVIEHARSAVFYQRQVAAPPSSKSAAASNKKKKSTSPDISSSSTTITEVVVEGSFSPFANLWLGCGVAISVCLPLALSSVMTSSWNSFGAFSSAAHNHQIQNHSTQQKRIIAGVNDAPLTVSTRQKLRALRHAVPINIWFVLLPLVIAFMCVVMIPVANSTNFGFVLAGLHIFVILPTIVAQFFPRFIAGQPQTILSPAPRNQNDRAIVQAEWKERTAQTLWIPVAFACFAAAILALHLINFLHVVGSSSAHRLFATIFKGFCYNNCQCSISLDVVQCSIVVMAFIFFFLPSLTFHERLFLSLATPFLSLGFTFSCAVALEEMRVLNHRLTNDVEGFDQVFPEILFNSNDEDDDESANKNDNTITLTVVRKSVSTAATISSKNNSSPKKLTREEEETDVSLQNISGTNKRKRKVTATETTKRTYLDNEDDDEEELFNIANAKQALSSKTANNKEVVRKLQQPIKPVAGNNNSIAKNNKDSSNDHPIHHHQRKLILEEERKRKIVLVDEDEQDEDEDEEMDEEFHLAGEDDEEEELSEGKSNEPRHDGDEESRSSGISGVYSEENETDEEQGEEEEEENE